MKKRVLITAIICIISVLAMALCIYSASQTRLLTVNAVFDGSVSVYVDGEYLSEAPLSRYVDQNAKITLVNSSDSFMFYADAEGNTFGYEGEYSFNLIGNTTIDAWYENTNTDKVCIIYKNTNDSQQLLASASYKVSELSSAFTDHIVSSSHNFGYEFFSWNKSVSDIIASAESGKGTIVVEPIYTEMETMYTVGVNGGYISSENDNNGSFAMHSSVKLKANEAPAGQKFAYWTNSAGKIVSNSPSITVTVISNETYTAKFVDENETVALVPSMHIAAAYDQNVGKIVTVAQRFLPDEYTIKGYGLIYSKDVEYSEDEMTCDAVDGVELRMSYNSSPQSANGIWINRISCEEYVCVRAYMIYEDAKGNSYTAYSNSVKSTLGVSKSYLYNLNFNDGAVSSEEFASFGTVANVNNALTLAPGYISMPITSNEGSVINVALDLKFTALPTEDTGIITINKKSMNVGNKGDGVYESWDSTESSFEYRGSFLVIGADGYLRLYSAETDGYVKTSVAIESNTLYKISASYDLSSGAVTLYVNSRKMAESVSLAVSDDTFDIHLMDGEGMYSATVDNVAVYYAASSGECTTHSYVSVVTPNSCEEQGYTTYTCSQCGSSYVSDYVDPIGSHSYGEGVLSDDGSTVHYTCSVCGDTYSDEYVKYTVLYDSVITSLSDAESLASRLSAATGYPFAVAEKHTYSGSKFIDTCNVSPVPEAYGWSVEGNEISIYCGAFVSVDTALEQFASSISSIKDLEALEDAEFTVAESSNVTPTLKYAETPSTASYLNVMSKAMIESVLSTGNTDLSSVSGTVYYVSEDGADYNDGMSDVYAWKTVSKINSANLSAGDAVLFKRGDMFRGNVTAVSGVTYGCYGDESLPKPIILGSKQNYAGLWTEVEDNIWQLGVTGIVDPGIIVFGANSYSVDQYDELTGNRIIDTNEILSSSTKVLYENDFSNPSNTADSNGSSVSISGGVLSMQNWGNNSWTKNISLNNSSGDITITFILQPNLQKTYDMLAINDQVVMSATSGGIVINGVTYSANKGYNLSSIVRLATVTVNPSTGNITVTYSHPTDHTIAEYISESFKISSFSGSMKLTIGSSSAGNGWTVDDLSVTQVTNTYKTGYSSLANDYDYYWGTPTTTFETFNQSSNSYNLYVYYSGDLNADFDSIEIGEDGKLFSVQKTQGVTVDGICFKYFGGHGIRGGNDSTTDLTVRNCVIAWGGGSILSFDNTTASVSRYGNGIEIFGSIDGMDVTNCWVYEIYDTGITFQYQGSTNKNDITMKDISIHNNLVERCYWGLEWWSSSYTGVTNASNINIYDNIVKSTGDSWGLHQHGDPRWGGALFIGGLGSTVADKAIKFYNNIIDCAYVAGYTGTEANPNTGVSSKGYINRLFHTNYNAVLQVEFTDNYFIQYNDQYIGRMSLGEDHPGFDIYRRGAYDWNFCFDAGNDELYEFFALFPYMQGTKVCILERPADLNQ